MNRYLLFVASLGCCLFSINRSQAQTTYTWNGNGNGNWNTASNWDANGIPANSLTLSDVAFGGVNNLLNTVDLLSGSGGGNYNIRTLNFLASAGTFNITPTNTNVTTLRIGTGGINVNSSVTQTISNPLALGANQSWSTITGGGNLIIDGTVNATGQNLTFAGNGNATLSQSATLTGGTVLHTSTGVTTLSANNTPTSVNVNEGTLVVNKVGSGSPIGTGQVTLSGGTLSFRVFGNPIAATGYNHDVITAISEFGNGTPFGTTRAVDGANGAGNYIYFQAGVDTANPGNGMPANGRFTFNSVNYQFQDYTGNNVLSLGGATTGTLTMNTPGQFRGLNLMHVTGSGSSTYTFRLNFSDATFTDVTGNNSPDWFDGPNPVFTVNGRLRRDTGVIENQNSGNPRIYATNYTLSAGDQLKTLTSIDFTPTTTGTFNVFGISGTAGSDTQVFTNNVTVTADSTLDQQNIASITLGTLSTGGFTLSKTGQTNSTMVFGATTFTGNPIFNVAIGNTLSLGAVNDSATARNLTKSGPGTLTLNAPVSSFGVGSVVNITGGTLNTTAAGAIGIAAAVNVSIGASFNTTTNQTIASLAGSGFATLNSNTLTINGGQTTSYAGIISGGALVVSGTNTNQTLNGVNTLTTTTVQSSSRLAVANPLALGTGPTTISGIGTTFSVGALQPTTISGFGGTGTGWNLQGTGGAPTVTADALTITTNVGGLARTAWLATPIAVGGSFTTSFRYSQLNGTGGADGATLTIQNSSPTAIGTAGGGLGYGGIGSSAALAINIYVPNTPGIALTAGGAQPTAPYTATGAVSLTNAGAGNEITVTLNYDGANLAGTLTQGANTFNIPSQALNLASFIGPSGFIGFTGGTGGVTATQIIDQFTYTTPAQSTYLAPVTISANTVATLSVAATATVPTITMNTLTTNAGAILTVQAETGTPSNLAYNLIFGATALNGNTSLGVVNNGTGAGLLTLGLTSGPGSLTKLNNGTLALPAANSYSGDTTITAGTLSLSTSGSFVNSTNIVVQTGAILDVSNVTGGANFNGTQFALVSGQTLRGIGTVNGPVAFNSGSTLSPGSSAGTLTVAGRVNFTAGSAYVWEIANTNPVSALARTGGSNSAGLQDGLVLTGGTNAINGAFTLRVTQLATPVLNPALPYSFLIATGPGTANVAGSVVDLSSASIFQTYQTNGGTVMVVVQNGNVYLDLTPVPEPGTVLGISALGLVAGRWIRLRLRKPDLDTN